MINLLLAILFSVSAKAADSVDVKIVSLDMPKGLKFGQIAIKPDIALNQIAFTYKNKSSKAVKVLGTFSIYPVDPVKGMQVGPTRTVTVGYPTLEPKQEKKWDMVTTLPLIYLARKYNVKVCITPFIENADGTKTEVKDSKPSNNCASGIYNFTKI